jgi:peptidyl-prolyl cis-trans isomerase C
MVYDTRVRLRATGARLGLMLGLLGAAACDRSASPGKGPAVAEADVVARVDGRPITRSDLEQRLTDQSAFVRARYTAPEKRKELLDSVVRFEVLAREAQSRGYAQDPDVLRWQKQRAIDRMIAAEIDGKLRPESITREELERVYREHAEDFTQKEAIRFDQIVVRDAAKANRVAVLARALPAEHDQHGQGFRQLVAAHSEDEDSKSRGGDSTFLERDSHDAPKPVLDAAFAAVTSGLPASASGRILGPIATERGHYVVRLSQRREPFLRPFETVEPLLRTRAIERRRRQEIEAWVAEARGRAKIEIYEDRLGHLGDPQKPPEKALEKPW